MQEVWRPIVGFEGLYEVSDLGKVRSLRRCPPKVLACYMSGSNSQRLAVKLGRGNGKYIARLVVEAFIGEIPEGMQVNHIDGNPLNNCVTNLEICTRSENIKHALASGLSNHQRCNINQSRGERHGMARLTESDILEIRSRYRKTGPRAGNGMQLAREFGVTHKQIHNIVRRKCWQSIP
jgi:hypothetical protein